LTPAEIESLETTYRELGERIDKLIAALSEEKNADAAASLSHAWAANRTLLRHLAQARARLTV
jgi:hypothetical protein